MTRWLVDGNNVFGSRPDGWWNDRDGAATRFAQRVAEWCRTNGDEVTVVFDPPLAPAARELAGGNLTIEQATRSGRDAADDRIVELTTASDAAQGIIVVTSDGGLRRRLPDHVEVMGAGRFGDMIGY